MLSNERRVHLLARLDEDGRASVDALARDLGVTPSTIRRDLARLAADGAVVRTYGGAAVGTSMPGRDPLDPRIDAKRAIGAAAAALVEDGQTIAISSGTTTLELARRLVDRRLTVITNALDVAELLLDRSGIELVVLGGVVRPGMHSMLGHLAELALRELRADALFMGIGALERRARPDERLDPGDPHRPGAAPRRPGLRRPRRQLEARRGGAGLRLRDRPGRHRRHRRGRRSPARSPRSRRTASEWSSRRPRKGASSQHDRGHHPGRDRGRADGHPEHPPG